MGRGLSRDFAPFCVLLIMASDISGLIGDTLIAEFTQSGPEPVDGVPVDWDITDREGQVYSLTTMEEITSPAVVTSQDAAVETSGITSVSYKWAWTPTEALLTDTPFGRFKGVMGVEKTGGLWSREEFNILVWPRISQLDPLIAIMQGLIQEPQIGEVIQFLSRWDYLAAIEAGLGRFNSGHEDVVLDHSTNELAATGHTEPFCRWAAGYALRWMRGNKASQEMEPQIGAAIVSFRDIQARCRQQGMEMMASAEADWAVSGEVLDEFAIPSFFGVASACRGR